MKFPRFIKNQNETEKKGHFLNNGATMLLQVIITFNGECNPIRSYSTEEVKKATSDFKWQTHMDSTCIMYRGVHEDREISGNLDRYIYDKHQQLPWERKLRIAIGIANAVAYLHHGLPKTIIYRNVKPTNIFLDQNYTAKLSEFQAIIPILEGNKTHVDVDVCGKFDFLALEVISNGRCREKSDVCGFRILFGQLLTGKIVTYFCNGSDLTSGVVLVEDSWGR
ncbi:Tyrosine-protein kinase [Trema orientale]|uniref:Tyrosine-protein kinase n=1 Tax=Trema orientale TaxID=63057 RepID=A0A2P5EUU5_TREOI|nr:Tyrosine-protein kinase [Trema orientale]